MNLGLGFPTTPKLAHVPSRAPSSASTQQPHLSAHPPEPSLCPPSPPLSTPTYTILLHSCRRLVGMFRPLPYFAEVPCPALIDKRHCAVSRCIFSHSIATAAVKPEVEVPVVPAVGKAESGVDARLRAIVAGTTEGAKRAVEGVISAQKEKVGFNSCCGLEMLIEFEGDG